MDESGQAMNIKVTPAYEVVPIENVEALRAIFPDGKCDELNFVMFSTSGTHGSYLSLDEVEASLETDAPERITVLVIQPRVVRMLYGNLAVSKDDMKFLRRLDTTSREVLRDYAA